MTKTATATNEKGTFVIRLHRALRAGVHHDLHLDGESWAVPKFVPTTASQGRRLAIKTAYHTPEQTHFEGDIPEGQYGAGKSEVVDEGEYIVISSSPEYVFFQLHGNTYRGNYQLRHWREDNWLLRKK